MSMIKRTNGEIKTFTDQDGNVVEAKQTDVVWADEKEKDEQFKDELRIPVVSDFALDIDASDDDDVFLVFNALILSNSCFLVLSIDLLMSRVLSLL